MIRKIILVCALVVLWSTVCFPTMLLAQAEMVPYHLYELPTFHYDLINVASPDPGLSRLQIFLKIAFDELQFTMTDTNFHASYEIAAVLYDKAGNQIDGKTQQEEVNAASFDLTNSRRAYSISYLKFDVEPGTYKITISLTDQESKQHRAVKDEIKLRDFSGDKLMISDLALVRNIQYDSLGVKSYQPDIADCIKELTEPLFVYFEIYSPADDDDQFDISYSMKNVKRKEVLKNSYLRRKDEVRTMESFALPISELPQGKYVLHVKVKGKSGEAETAKPIFIRWANMPATVSDIDLAIRQLKYITDKKEFDKLNRVDADEKLKRFEQFWREHDPTPGTEANEAMDEFYRRVQYSNENFSVFREGWKTDMGMIYIIFGPPSDVERHPFDLEYKPHEIWYYNDINKQFVFMDQTGFGEYRLITIGWEAWRSLAKNPW